ncbi:zinc-binding dehydrogenase [Annulohypoxylon maeteangense]|uniref:zinc-binding dehydrogenase n=1 Tax=Annulohypoxylon maeteangense TaxID=1927788 RepID=UPI0020076D4E|nr:zinc-binding dehydrogenase [Annulohypoxylon maeteangense]KAI0888669.1 zinc-binding dehydrogenase [Annulohypoxylon maeteangense]
MQPPAPIPATQRAIIQGPAGQPTIANDVPTPVLRPGTVLIKTIAVSLNPSDNKMGAAFPCPGAVIGMDFLGRIVDIKPAEGVESPSSDLRLDDMVCGVVHGSNPGDPTTGSFAEYVRAQTDLVLRVPENFPLEQAVALGTPLLTSCVALWSSLAITALPESPLAKPVPVLVYGGSTTCGTMAIQLLKILGYDPVATCSSRNFDMVKSYGASAVFDYTATDLGHAIKTHTGGRLRHALDCIADQASTTCCYASLGRPGGRYAYLEASPKEWKTREAVKADFALAYEAFGHEVKLDGEYGRPASPEKHETAAKIFRAFQKLLDEGKVKGHPTEVVGHGFESILEGLRRLKSGSVSGKRLVVWIE